MGQKNCDAVPRNGAEKGRKTMKKQYVITFRNTNIKLSQTLRYLTKVERGYARKTTEITEAARFGTKAAAQDAIASISKNNRYGTEINIVLA